MIAEERRSLDGWLPIGAGLVWLWNGPGLGPLGFALAVFPGALLLGAGLASLLRSGDPRIARFAGLGGALGGILALVLLPFAGLGEASVLGGVSLAAFLAAGHRGLRFQPERDEVPVPVPSLRLCAQVACDEAALAVMTLTTPAPRPPALERLRAELEEAHALFESAGWIEKPAEYHVRPPPLDDPHRVDATLRGLRYEHLRFEGGYEPHADEPGRARWLSYSRNRTAHAWVLRHPDAQRPWLICIHGYGMGSPPLDFAAFRPSWLHHRLGLNLLLPVLPLHGPRAVAWRSGRRFVSGDTLDTVHAVANAVWDLRRLITWVQGQGAPKIGAFGLSLGAYHAALLASLGEELTCAVAGIPAADFLSLLRRNASSRDLPEPGSAEAIRIESVLRVISPLAVPVSVPKSGLGVFAGVADRVTPPDQALQLWRHWNCPRIAWYQGSHLSFPWHAAVRELTEETLREGGLAL